MRDAIVLPVGAYVEISGQRFEHLGNGTFAEVFGPSNLPPGVLPASKPLIDGVVPVEQGDKLHEYEVVQVLNAPFGRCRTAWFPPGSKAKLESQRIAVSGAAVGGDL